MNHIDRKLKGLQPLICGCFVLFTLTIAASVFAVETDDGDREISAHGPREFLLHSLLQSPEDARLIAAAERHLNRGEYTPAFQALLAVFSRDHGQFSPVFRDKPISETGRAGLNLLMTAPFSVRREWTASVEARAANALTRAGQLGARDDLLQVARMYPLTASAFRALNLAAASAWRSGQRRMAVAILAEMESTYLSVSLSFPVRDKVDALRRKVASEGIGPAPSRFAAQPLVGEVAEPALPGYKPLWSWHEELWKTPQIVPSTGVLNQPIGRAYLAQSVWEPAFRNDEIILRTPTQIAAFDKMSGEKLWSLATDTVTPVPSSVDSKESLSQFHMGNAATSQADLLQMDDFGAVTVTDRLVVFVDHFRRFSTGDRLRLGGGLANRGDFHPLQKESEDGSRLVCVSTSGDLRVLWTVGDAPEFRYAIQSGGELNGESGGPPSGRSQDFEATSAAPDNVFTKHRFLGPPLAHDRQLFVLTSDQEQVWLNCLAQGTGRLEWRRPISFHESTHRHTRQLYLRISENIHGASLCGISGNTLVCTLKSGLVIGTRIFDGQTLWATNFRDPTTGDDGRTLRQGLTAYINARSSGGTFRPLLHDDRLVWSAPRSFRVRCADISTGELLWSCSREAEGLGTLEGSADQYAVGTFGDRVLFVGERHLRAVSLEDGRQAWATQLPQRSGRAVCVSDKCLVPCLDGTIRLYDNRTGTLAAIESDQGAAMCGSLYADNDVVCASTPISMHVFPSIQTLRNQSTRAEGTVAHRLQRIRLQLKSGKRRAAITALKQLWTDADVSADPQLRRDIRDALINAVRQTIQYGSDDAGADHVALIREVAGLVEFNERERLAFAVLGGLDADTLNAASGTSVLRDEPVLLDVTPDWKIRSDVAAAWEAFGDQDGDQDVAEKIKDRFLEHAILAPRQLGDMDAQQAFAARLIADHRPAAAEMFLIAAAEHAEKTERDALEAVLRELRGVSREDSSDPADGSSSEAGSTSPAFSDFRFSEVTDIHHSLPSLVRAKPQVLPSPQWFGQRLLLVGSSLHTVENNTSAVSIPFDLPASASPESVDFRDHRPSILPLSGIDRVGAVSLADPRHVKQLWWRSVKRDATDFSPITIGTIGASHFTIATGASLQCLHPLTGNTLWRRRFYPAELSQNTFYSSVRVVGDSEVTAVLGEHLHSCTTFDTATGRDRGNVKLRLQGKQIPLVSGRNLLFVEDGALVLQDLKDGADLLADQPRISIAPNGRAQLLSDRRAAVITADGRFVLLDMRNGRIQQSISLSEDVELQQMTGMKVIERADRLYVVIKVVAPDRYSLSASSPVGDDRVDHGFLVAIDPHAGNVVWVRSCSTSLMPSIFGDAAPFEILWSRRNDFASRNLGGRIGDSMTTTSELTIIDRNTGETLVDDHPFSVSDPLHCLYDATQQRLMIRTERSVIEVTCR